MSTRYVWEKFDVKALYTEQSATVSGYSFTPNGANWLAITEGYSFDKNTGAFSPENLRPDFFLNDNTVPMALANSFQQIFPCIDDFSINNQKVSSIFINDLYTDRVLYWHARRQDNGTIRLVLSNSNDFSASLDSLTTFNFSRKYGAQNQYEQGETSQGKVSASRSNAYPTDGTNSAHTIWYDYLGADSIDPAAVTCSSDSPHPGETVQIRVVPGSNLYGGAISYQYYVKIGTGSWSSLGSKTTETVKNYTIPETAQQVQFRVLASDDMGFTSTTYVTSAVLIIGAITAYVGVAGKARKIEKIYIGVNGKAREVDAIYVGINGKARKIM